MNKLVSFLIIAAASAVLAFPAFAQEPLRLPGLLKEAEAKNPMLAAKRSAYEAAKERIPQAGALDNPMVGVGVQNLPVDSFAFDREMMTGKMLELSQMLPFFGKRELKRQAARAEAEAAEAEYRGQALMVRAEVKKAFYDLYAVRKSLQTVEKNIELMDAFRRTAESLYSVGKGMLKDVIKAQVETSMLVERRLDLLREEASKRAYLGSLVGQTGPVAGEVPDITATGVNLDREALLAIARERRPAVTAAQSRVEGGEAKVRLARRERYPDFTFRLAYMQRDRLRDGVDPPDMATAMVSVNLPVWYRSKLDPMVREAAAERAMAASEKDAEITGAGSDIYSMAADIEQADKMLRLYSDALIPQANEDLSSGLATYETGKGDFLTLLDSRRTLFDLELSYFRTLAMREKAVAELGAAVGKEF